MPSESKSQQRLFGQVHACQKYGKCSSEKVKDIASRISDKDAEDFASTKHKGLPEKKEKNEKKDYDKKTKKHKPFEEWLKERDPHLFEVATSTADVAMFKAPLMSSIRRRWPEDEEHRKKSQRS